MPSGTFVRCAAVMMMLTLSALVSAQVAAPAATEPNALRIDQPAIVLWPGGAPGSAGRASAETWIPNVDGYHRVTHVDVPVMYAFVPDATKATGAAVLICPGGAHKYLGMDKEGTEVAEGFVAMGVAAFVLKSRLSHAENSPYTLEDSLADVQRALRIIRTRAAEWRVTPTKIGIIGFSAGGELSAMAETRFDAPVTTTDSIDRASARPDFAILMYPAMANVTFTARADAPRTLLIVAADDQSSGDAVPDIYAKLRAVGVSAEAHIYSQGGHGFGSARAEPWRALPVASWMDRVRDWLK